MTRVTLPHKKIEWRVKPYIFEQFLSRASFTPVEICALLLRQECCVSWHFIVLHANYHIQLVDFEHWFDFERIVIPPNWDCFFNVCFHIPPFVFWLIHWSTYIGCILSINFSAQFYATVHDHITTWAWWFDYILCWEEVYVEFFCKWEVRDIEEISYRIRTIFF